MQGCLRKMHIEFLVDFQFLWFFCPFSKFWIFFGPPMAKYRLTWWTIINYSTFEIKFFMSLPRNLSRVAKIGLKSSKLGKKSQILKISQKLILHFFEASLHVPWCFIPQKNSQASLIIWLKGYSVIFTSGQEISKQSWGGNRGTPCSIVFKKLMMISEHPNGSTRRTRTTSARTPTPIMQGGVKLTL